jgi:hypothetical protein
VKVDDVEMSVGQQAVELTAFETRGSGLLRDEWRQPSGAAVEGVMHDGAVIVVWTGSGHSLGTQQLKRIDAVRDLDVMTALGERVDQPTHGDPVPPEIERGVERGNHAEA